jgi:hypothetical protein
LEPFHRGREPGEVSEEGTKVLAFHANENMLGLVGDRAMPDPSGQQPNRVSERAELFLRQVPRLKGEYGMGVEEAFRPHPKSADQHHGTRWYVPPGDLAWRMRGARVLEAPLVDRKVVGVGYLGPMLRRTLPLVTAGCLLVSGCGSDDDSDAAAGSSTSTSAAPATTSTTAATPGGFSETTPLSLNGIGPVTAGMTLEEASAASGRTFTAPGPDQPSPSELCNWANYTDEIAGLSFMILRDTEADPWRIARVEVEGERGGKIVTEAGIGVGATEDQVKQAYGGITSEPHTYVEEGHYLIYDPDGPGGSRLLFETDGKVVTRFRSGEQEAVGYVEGCA